MMPSVDLLTIASSEESMIAARNASGRWSRSSMASASSARRRTPSAARDMAVSAAQTATKSTSAAASAALSMVHEVRGDRKKYQEMSSETRVVRALGIV